MRSKISWIVFAGILFSAGTYASMPAEAVVYLTDKQVTQVMGAPEQKPVQQGMDAAPSRILDEQAEIVGGAFEPYGGVQWTRETSVPELYAEILRNASAHEGLLTDVGRTGK